MIIDHQTVSATEDALPLGANTRLTESCSRSSNFLFHEGITMNSTGELCHAAIVSRVARRDLAYRAARYNMSDGC